MNKYVYQGLTKSGQPVRGEVEATDQKAAINTLLEKGHFVTAFLNGDENGSEKTSSLMNISGKWKSRNIKSKDILHVFSQLSVALKAGLSLLNAIEVIREQQHKPEMETLLENITIDIKKGESLSSAIGRHPLHFSALSLVKLVVFLIRRWSVWFVY